MRVKSHQEQRFWNVNKPAAFLPGGSSTDRYAIQLPPIRSPCAWGLGLLHWRWVRIECGEENWAGFWPVKWVVASREASTAWNTGKAMKFSQRRDGSRASCMWKHGLKLVNFHNFTLSSSYSKNVPKEVQKVGKIRHQAYREWVPERGWGGS